MRWIAILLLSVCPVWGQFDPTPSRAVNAASFAAPASPAGKLPRGGLISVFGIFYLAENGATATAFPLSPSLGGVELEITVGGVTRAAFPLYVGVTQINAIVSSETPAGAGELVVTVNGVRSEPLAVEVADHAPGIFTLRGSGGGPGILTDPLDGNPNTRINSGLRAAHAGEAWDLWATGLGAIPTSDAGQAPFFDRTDLDVRVLVGGRDARLLYRGRSGCCSGLDQIRFLIPDGVEGCCVPLELVVNGVVSNRVSLSIGPQDRLVCETHALQDIADEIERYLTNGEEYRYATLGLGRQRLYDDLDNGVVYESAAAYFYAWRIVSWIYDPCAAVSANGLSGPCFLSRSDGTTIAFDLDGNELGRVAGSTPDAQVSALRTERPPLSEELVNRVALAQASDAVEQSAGLRTLDAGPSIRLEGPEGVWELPKQSVDILGTNYYAVTISNGVAFGPDLPANELPSGTYRFEGMGGPDVGAFSAEVDAFRVEWSNRDAAFPEVPRDSALAVRWRGARGDQPVVVSGTSDGSSAWLDSSTFSCTAEPGSDGITLHPNLLREMHRTGRGDARGELSVTGQSIDIRSLGGIDSVYVAYSDSVTQSLRYTGAGIELPQPQFAVKVDPPYPAEAREAGVEGVVVVEGTVFSDGRLFIDGPPQGPPMLVAAVLSVLDQWRIENVDSFADVQVEVTFSLSEGVRCEILLL